jgi:hypothetical protein
MSITDHIISTPPLFVNLSEKDYRLKITSNCKDYGNSTLCTVYDYDLDENTRVNGIEIDLGCYENTSDLSSVLKKDKINTEFIAEPITVSPNPSNGSLPLEVTIKKNDSDINEIIYVNIYDINGKKVFSSIYSTTEKILINHELPQGLYFLEVANTKNGKNTINKIIIN